MAIVYHRNMFVTVARHEDRLRAECALLSKREEAAAWLECRVDDLLISDAGFAGYRSPRATARYCRLPQLAGVKAHLQAGPALKQALGEEYKSPGSLLLSECIRGIVQAETYLYRERGFDSTSAYDAHWERIYRNSCRYYSNLDRVKNSWMEYVSPETRLPHLFFRSHTVTVLQGRQGPEFIGVFMDSFHEMHIELLLSADGVINKISGRVVRAPDAVCFENDAHIAGFKGLSLKDLSKKDIALLAGGAQGCSHLVDLLHDLSAAAAEWPLLHLDPQGSQQDKL